MKELIDVFNLIRIIPYKIIEVEYSIENAYNLINLKAASCTPKHIVLADKIGLLGFETRFCVHEFKWSDFNLNFPKDLDKLLNYIPLDFHTNLEVKIKDNWIMVDATWDDGLIDAGLPGTKFWDGFSPTVNCVHSLKDYRFKTIEDRNDFLYTENRKNTICLEDKSEFTSLINTFLNSKRIAAHS